MFDSREKRNQTNCSGLWKVWLNNTNTACDSRPRKKQKQPPRFVKYLYRHIPGAPDSGHWKWIACLSTAAAQINSLQWKKKVFSIGSKVRALTAELLSKEGRRGGGCLVAARVSQSLIYKKPKESRLLRWGGGGESAALTGVLQFPVTGRICFLLSCLPP